MTETARVPNELRLATNKTQNNNNNKNPTTKSKGLKIKNGQMSERVCMFSMLQGLMERPGLLGVMLMNDMKKNRMASEQFFSSLFCQKIILGWKRVEWTLLKGPQPMEWVQCRGAPILSDRILSVLFQSIYISGPERTVSICEISKKKVLENYK